VKTIKQIADEIGVSRQAIQKRMLKEPLNTKLRPYMQIKNGTKYVDETGENIIKSAYDKTKLTSNSKSECGNRATVTGNQATDTIGEHDNYATIIDNQATDTIGEHDNYA
jgi:uncharacterized membrane-anchored protein